MSGAGGGRAPPMHRSPDLGGDPVHTASARDGSPPRERRAVRGELAIREPVPDGQDRALPGQLSRDEAVELPLRPLPGEERVREDDDAVPTADEPVVDPAVEAVAQSQFGAVIPRAHAGSCERGDERVHEVLLVLARVADEHVPMHATEYT